MIFSRSDPLEESFFGLSKWLIGFLGFWPLDPLNLTTVIKSFISLSVILTAIFGEFRMTWLLRREPIEAFHTVCPVLTKTTTCLKLICFLVYRRDLAKLIRDIKDHLKEDTKDPRKSAQIGNTSFLAAVSVTWLFCFAHSTNVAYSARPLLVWTYQRLTGQHPTKVELPFSAALPYKDMSQVEDVTLYTFLFCLLAHSGNVTAFGVSGIDGAYLNFCLYLSVAHQCLGEDFESAFRRHAADDFVCRANEQLCKELTALVKRQQNIHSMFHHFNRVFRFIIFDQFLLASIVLGVVLVDLLLCLKLCETLYFCEWYKCDKRVRRLVLYIMARAQRGSLLRAPFFSPSVPLFARIMSTSGSYITMLKTFL